MKAVVITKENQEMLAARYGLGIDEFLVGYIMITNFGDNGELRYEGLLTEENFNLQFVKGEAIDNGFFAITRKNT